LQGLDGKRRQMLRLAVAGATALPLGMLTMQTPQAWRRWNAEFRTAVGEISPLPLRDGAVAVLDTDSSADVVYEEAARRVLLRNGRVYIKTGPDRGNPLRPLIVQTAYGDVLALDSEFVVCVGDGRGQVRVNQNEVRVVPRGGRGGERRLAAGQWADFSASVVGPVQQVESNQFAVWRNGSLIAVNMPLGRFVERFRAYRPGMLLLDDSLAELPVSGTFPLARSDLALNALENSYPVEIRRLTRYVTWIVPRSEPSRQV
jgi:transmembrane sensor